MQLSVFRRITPIILALALCLSWLPAGAFAEEVLISEPEESTAATEETLLPTEESAPAAEETTEPTETVPEEILPPETTPEETLPAEPTVPETIPEETEVSETVPAGTAALTSLPPEPLGPGLYFGLLHAHCAFSDGTVTAEEAFSRAAQAGMDFLALTDHGDSLTESDWTAGKAAADAATASSFVGIYGYEMNWPARMQIGHIGTLGTAGFRSWQEGFDTFDSALKNYYAAMAATSGAIGQFNHPGTQYGNFCDFSPYSEAADGFMELLETDGSIGQYVNALDAGWHVAPTWATDSRNGAFGSGRTAVHADTLTEEGIYDALGRHRVYATADPDLEIGYTLDGHTMGSVLEDRNLGETADVSVTLSDPTDTSVGLVEVITESGTVLDSQTLSASTGSLCFSLSPEYAYYFLRITQPDGDIAITAPVWVSQTEDLGIASFSCETAVPVQGEETTLQLSLYNRENTDFLVDSLEILADGNVIFTDSDLAGIPADSDMTHTLTVLCGCLGQTTITARLTGTLEDEPRTYEASLTLSFRQSSLVTDILVDGSHGNGGTDKLTLLTALAAEHDIRVTVAEEITAEALENCRFLVVSAPGEPFPEEFLDLVSQYAACGGSVILCGQARCAEEDESAFRLNVLLSSLGSSLRLRADAIGTPDPLYPDVFNTDSPWCGGISGDQVYRLDDSCSVDAGGGQWLVKSGDTAVLACEELISGSTVFAAGSLFFSDESIPAPECRWEEPYANRTILRNLLNIGGETLALNTIAQARAGEAGQLFRVRGYVTAGTSNPCNTFPETLYLQDDTGGIAVMPFTESGIRVGTPMEITGYAEIRNGNRILKTVSHEVLDAALYQYQPRTGSWETLLDADKNGGLLVEVEGECTGILCREDGTLSGVLLKNKDGQTAKVLIEDNIFSGATGENTLHEEIRKGRSIRAMGLVYLTQSGETVIRVRNCDEVAYVPPNTYINPKTGDPFFVTTAVMILSAAALLLLKRKK